MTAGAAIVVLSLAGCSVLGPGPLQVRGGGGTCSTVAPPATTYFGQDLENLGGDDVMLLEVRARESVNLSGATFLVDVEGPSLDQRIGSMAWPAQEPGGWEEQVMERAVDPEDAVIPPATTATLLMSLEPLDPAADVQVQSISVRYRSGGHVRTVFTDLEVSVSADQECASE